MNNLLLPSKITWIGVAISMAFLVFFSIFQVGLMTKEIYAIRDYQKKIKDLSHANKLLEINFSQKNSLSYVEDLIKNLNFEKTNKIQYIQVLEGQVVAK